MVKSEHLNNSVGLRVACLWFEPSFSQRKQRAPLFNPVQFKAITRVADPVGFDP